MRKKTDGLHVVKFVLRASALYPKTKSFFDLRKPVSRNSINRLPKLIQVTFGKPWVLNW